MDDRTLREMINTQTATILALRGIVTVLLSGEEMTEDAVLEVIQPLLNPHAKIKVRNEFHDIIRGVATDVLTTAHLRSSKPTK